MSVCTHASTELTKLFPCLNSFQRWFRKQKISHGLGENIPFLNATNEKHPVEPRQPTWGRGESNLVGGKTLFRVWPSSDCKRHCQNSPDVSALKQLYTWGWHQRDSLWIGAFCCLLAWSTATFGILTRLVGMKEVGMKNGCLFSS